MAPFRSLAKKARQKLQKLSNRSYPDVCKDDNSKTRSNAIRLLVEREIRNGQESSAVEGIDICASTEGSKPTAMMDASADSNMKLNQHEEKETIKQTYSISREWSWSPSLDALSGTSSFSDNRESISPYINATISLSSNTVNDPHHLPHHYGPARFGYDYEFSSTTTGDDAMFSERNYIEQFFDEAMGSRLEQEPLRTTNRHATHRKPSNRANY